MIRAFILSPLVAALVAAPAVAAGLTVSDAWVRLPAVPGRPAAAYFMLMGGDQPVTVTGISSPAAARGELHQSMMSGGLMKMTPVKDVRVGKRAMVMFKPGGKHAMLFGLDPKVKPGAAVRLNLALAGGGTASVEAKAVGAAEAPPTGHGHDH